MLFFFFHSDYTGSGAECVMLARRLGPGLRLVGIAPHGSVEGPVPPTIEAMAAGHVSRVQTLQPHGPYHLAGHCSAGVVAFELARQLRAAGEMVETLVLIEPPPLRAVQAPGGRPRRLGPSPLRHAWIRARFLAARAGAALTRGRLLDVVMRALWARQGEARDSVPAVSGPRAAELAYAGAVARYVAARYPGCVTCIRTEASAGAGEFDPGAWREAADTLRVHVVPGDHESCLAAEAGALADRLRACLGVPEGATR
jgi:thioesterase domain-containing protein